MATVHRVLMPQRRCGAHVLGSTPITATEIHEYRLPIACKCTTIVLRAHERVPPRGGRDELVREGFE